MNNTLNVIIRNESKADYKQVEELTREAFWNLHAPGCDEHYLVHTMRSHPDFLPELDFVAVLDDKIVGNIMFTRSFIADDYGNRVDTITFGPISVLPGFQRKGIGTALINHSKKIALEHNHKAIIIYGHPHNYCLHGFKSSKDYNISDSEGRYPYSLLVLELQEGALKEQNWKFHESGAYDIDPKAAENFDKNFSPKKKSYQFSQEEFKIARRAYLM